MEHLISKEYQKEITDHHNIKTWGGAVIGKTSEIHKYAVLSGAKTILDYGAGQGSFKTTVKNYSYNPDYEIVEYEPGIPEKAGDPPVCDFTICVDVLEHVEPDKIDAVLEHIYNKTRKFVYLSISTQPSMSNFSNMKNLHILVRPADWWVQKLKEKNFKFIDLIITKGGVLALVKV